MSGPNLRAVAREILEQFGLADPQVRLVRIKGKVLYRIEAGGSNRYILRIYTDGRRSGAALTAQLRWMRAINAETEIGSPTPIPTRSGRLFASINNSATERRIHGVLLRWVEGRRANARSFVHQKKLTAVGRTTAMLHVHAATYRDADLAACPLLDAEHFLGPKTCVGPRGREIFTRQQHNLVRRAADRIRRAMRQLVDSNEEFGLVHADLEPPNWVFHRGEARPIDFDEFGLGYFAFDLMQIIWTHALWDQYPMFREALLRGYESVRPISSKVRPHLDLFQAIPFLWWLNKGLMDGYGTQGEFRRWLVPSIRRIDELCREAR